MAVGQAVKNGFVEEFNTLGIFLSMTLLFIELIIPETNTCD